MPEMLEPLDRPVGLDADRRRRSSKCSLLAGATRRSRPRRRPASRPSTSVSGLNGESPFAIAEAEVRRAAVDDRLAVRRRSAALAVDAALGRADVRQRAHLRRAATRRAAARSSPARSREVEGRLAGDRRRPSPRGLGEDRVERLVDRVGEHERAADHRDAEHDRERGQRGAGACGRAGPRARTWSCRGDLAHRREDLGRGSRRRARGRSGRRRGRGSGRRSRRRAASWVTITVVWPYVVDRAAQRARGSRRSVCESRLPVGSSAKTTVGRETSARAIATRCCWPPESSDGRCVQPVGEADRRRAARRSHARVRLLAGDRERQHDVLLGRQHRQQVEELEDEADVACGAASSARCRSSVVISVPAIATVPDVGLSSPARMCISVDLPGARRAHDRGQLARARRRARRRAARRPRCRPRRSGA